MVCCMNSVVLSANGHHIGHYVHSRGGSCIIQRALSPCLYSGGSRRDSGGSLEPLFETELHVFHFHGDIFKKN